MKRLSAQIFDLKMRSYAQSFLMGNSLLSNSTNTVMKIARFECTSISLLEQKVFYIYLTFENNKNFHITHFLYIILFKIHNPNMNNGHALTQNSKVTHDNTKGRARSTKPKSSGSRSGNPFSEIFCPGKLVVFESLINDAIETLQISPAIYYLGRTIAIGVVWNRWKTPCSFWEVMNFPEWLPQPPMRRLKIPFSCRDNEKRPYKTRKSSKAGESATTVSVEGFWRFRCFEVGLFVTTSICMISKDWPYRWIGFCWCKHTRAVW